MYVIKQGSGLYKDMPGLEEVAEKAGCQKIIIGSRRTYCVNGK